MEGSLEFIEEEGIGLSPGEIASALRRSVEQIVSLLDLAPAGRLLRDGVQVVLAGPANVGKSSLFNALLEEDRAIVDGEAGTTRDVVSAAVEKNGTRYVFHDTAGLRVEAGRIEKMGIDRTLQAVEKADIILALFEREAQPNPVEIGADDAVVLSIMTKVDQLGNGEAKGPEDVILTSSTSGQGLPDLWSALQATVAAFHIKEAVAMGVVLNERHRHKLDQCRLELGLLLEEFHGSESGEGPGPEVVGTILSSILSQFGEISGRVFSEQLLESIFSRFCVGK